MASAASTGSLDGAKGPRSGTPMSYPQIRSTAVTQAKGKKGEQPETPKQATQAEPTAPIKEKQGKPIEKRAVVGEKRKADEIPSSDIRRLCATHKDAINKKATTNRASDELSIAELVSAGTSLESIKVRIYSLKDEPHPLFRNVEWQAPDLPGVNTGLGGNDREFYSNILPALQIASKVLVHPDVLPFWHGLIESRRTGRRQGLEYHFRAESRLTKKETAMTLAVLEELAPAVSIWSGSLRISGPDSAWCSRLALKPGDAGYDPKVQKTYGRNQKGEWTVGLPSYWRYMYILFSSQKVDIARSWQRPDSDMSIAEVQNFYFRLAVQLLHEMAHAIQQLVQRQHRCFFRDETISEIGFSFENFVFGGLVRGTSASKWKHLMVITWPNADLYTLYLNHYPMPIRGWSPGKQWASFVRQGYVPLFFDPEFWKLRPFGDLDSTRQLQCCGIATKVGLQGLLPTAEPGVSNRSARRRLLLLPKCCGRVCDLRKLRLVEGQNQGALREVPNAKRIKLVHEPDPEIKSSGFGHVRSKIVLQRRAERLEEKFRWRELKTPQVRRDSIVLGKTKTCEVPVTVEIPQSFGAESFPSQQQNP